MKHTDESGLVILTIFLLTGLVYWYQSLLNHDAKYKPGECITHRTTEPWQKNATLVIIDVGNDLYLVREKSRRDDPNANEEHVIRTVDRYFKKIGCYGEAFTPQRVKNPYARKD